MGVRGVDRSRTWGRLGEGENGVWMRGVERVVGLLMRRDEGRGRMPRRMLFWLGFLMIKFEQTPVYI